MRDENSPRHRPDHEEIVSVPLALVNQTLRICKAGIHLPAASGTSFDAPDSRFNWRHAAPTRYLNFPEYRQGLAGRSFPTKMHRSRIKAGKSFGRQLMQHLVLNQAVAAPSPN